MPPASQAGKRLLEERPLSLNLLSLAEGSVTPRPFGMSRQPLPVALPARSAAALHLCPGTAARKARAASPFRGPLALFVGGRIAGIAGKTSVHKRDRASALTHVIAVAPAHFIISGSTIESPWSGSDV